MTREEAIEIVKTAFSVWELEFRRTPNDDWSEEHEALDMAIEALRQETVSRETYDHEFNLRKEFEMKAFELERKIANDMAIEALEAREWDEFVFDMNEFFSIVDNGKITVMRKGRGKVTVERPVMQMETTICSYGERNE